MAITNRTEFIDYVKRTLGEPVIRVNVLDEQINDRINDALDFYRMYHYSATEKIIVKTQVTQEMKDNGYISTPYNIEGVTSLWFANASSISGDWHGYFSKKVWENVSDSNGSGITSYLKAEANIDEFNNLFKPHTNWSFNRNTNRIIVYADWELISLGDFIVYEAIAGIDPDQNPDIYNDWWFKRYVIALVKQQWGINLSKFKNVELPGGMTIDGDSLKEEGKQEQQQMEEEIQQKFGFYGQIYLG